MHDELSSHIQITATIRSPMYRLVEEKSGSVNFITWNKAYALFPQFAFIDRAESSWDSLAESAAEFYGSNYDEEYESTYGGVVEDYFEYGEWHEINFGGVTVMNRELDEKLSRNTKRRTGDRLTWTISFDARKVTTQSKDWEGTYFGMFQGYFRDHSVDCDKYEIWPSWIVATWMTHVYDSKNQGPGRRAFLRRRDLMRRRDAFRRRFREHGLM